MNLFKSADDELMGGRTASESLTTDLLVGVCNPKSALS